MDLKEEDILGEAIATHWYYVSKGRMVRSLLAATGTALPVGRMLDVGAGSGVFARQFLEAGLAREAVCVDPGYAADRDESHAGRPLRFRRAAPEGDAGLVVMMDVLEHVADDAGLLRAHLDGAAPGTRLLVTVPAFEALWSGHDVSLEHHRRYTRARLTRVLVSAGLRPVSVRYFFGLLFPAVAAIRLVDRLRLGMRATEPKSAMRPAGPAMNRLMTAVHDAERLAVFPWNRLAGLTVVAVAEKP